MKCFPRLKVLWIVRKSGGVATLHKPHLCTVKQKKKTFRIYL